MFRKSNSMKHYYFLFALLISLVVASGAQASDSKNLIVGKGETRQLTPTTSVLRYDRLELGDGAQLVLNGHLPSLQLKADRVKIGAGATIVAAGRPGASGVAGEAIGKTTAVACASGVPGNPGRDGESSTAGLDMILEFGLVTLGSLSVDVSGGAGGDGGDGSAGQAGGEFGIDCNSPKGGAGGTGGDAGSGGAGGTVRLYYHWADGDNGKDIQDRIKANTNGGPAGKPGIGGLGGAGSEGKYVNRRTLAGNKKWLAGGKDGKPGATGTTGKPGKDGQFIVQQQFESGAPIAPAVPANKVKPAVESTTTLSMEDLIRKLEQQEQELRDLRRRVERLEKR